MFTTTTKAAPLPRRLKISFVIPALNEEKYIKETLVAILNQAQLNLIKEIIVVNNGSTDRTAAIVRNFKNNVRLIDQPKPGLALTRLTGFKAAKGDIIASIDADTLIPPYWAERIEEKFSANHHLMAIGGPYIYTGKEKWWKIISYSYAAIIMKPIHTIINSLKLGGTLNGGNFAFRRSALPALEHFAKDVNFGGDDAYIAKKIRKYGPINFSLYIPAKTSARRFKKQGLLKTLGTYNLDFLWVLTTGKPLHNNQH